MDFDVAVLGGGPAGYTAAIRAAQLGARVACIEREAELGGTCLRVGLHPDEGVGLDRARAPRCPRDRPEARRRHGRARARLRDGERVEGAGREADDGRRRVALQGEQRHSGSRAAARFEDARSIVFDKGELGVSFKSAIVATGSYPIRPPIPGLESPRCVDSTGLLAQTEVPRRLVVLGGGIIGCEFASIFERFGTEVTMIEMLESLIPQEDDDATSELRKSFARRGIVVHLGKQCTQGRGHGRRARRPLRRGRDDRVRPDARLRRPRAARRGHRSRGGGCRVRPARGHRDGRPSPNVGSAHLRGRRRRRLLAARAHGVPRGRGRRGERDGARGADAGLTGRSAPDLHRSRDRRRRAHGGAGGRAVRRRERRRRAGSRGSRTPAPSCPARPQAGSRRFTSRATASSSASSSSARTRPTSSRPPSSHSTPSRRSRRSPTGWPPHPTLGEGLKIAGQVALGRAIDLAAARAEQRSTVPRLPCARMKIYTRGTPRSATSR